MEKDVFILKIKQIICVRCPLLNSGQCKVDDSGLLECIENYYDLGIELNDHIKDIYKEYCV